MQKQARAVSRSLGGSSAGICEPTSAQVSMGGAIGDQLAAYAIPSWIAPRSCSRSVWELVFWLLSLADIFENA
eukprot:2196889-Karenia_brevis.AAC.1